MTARALVSMLRMLRGVVMQWMQTAGTSHRDQERLLRVANVLEHAALELSDVAGLNKPPPPNVNARGGVA